LADSSLSRRVIDLHCHVLPGLDDGPRTMSASLKMARAAVGLGVETIVATPHVSETFENRSADIREATAALTVELVRRGIPLNLRTGAEITIDKALEVDDGELTALRLGGGPYLLVECPLTRQDGKLVETLLMRVQERGHRVLLAHPERSPVFLHNIARLRRLVDEGMLTSVTAGAFTGHFGQLVRMFTMELLREGLVHDVASDAHDHEHRSHASLAHAARARWYTREAQAAILEGRPLIPPQRTAIERAR
jgi:protein-tyrosine phosphatase